MPNWCFTSYALTGPKRSVKALYTRMKGIQDEGKYQLKNGFGKRWLGNLVHSFGRSWKRVGCRGDWMNLVYDEINNVLMFDTQTAWDRCHDVEGLIQSRYENIDIYFISEEFGNDIFETNDEKGRFFPEQYAIDYQDEFEFFTKDGFFERMREISGKDEAFPSFESARQWCNKYNEENDAWDIYIHKAELAL